MVHIHLGHLADVDHDAGVDNRQALVTVATGAHADRHVPVTRPAHGVDYVLRLPGEDDDQREPVEEGVELLPGRVVLRLTW